MSQCRKNSLALALGLALLAPSQAPAEIVVEYGLTSFSVLDYSVSPPQPVVLTSPRGMPSIILTPGAPLLPSQSGYLALRSNAWQQYHRSDVSTREGLVAAPALGSAATAPVVVLQNRRNIARAQAYRQDYFKK
jgi:hypothetical protein